MAKEKFKYFHGASCGSTKKGGKKGGRGPRTFRSFALKGGKKKKERPKSVQGQSIFTTERVEERGGEGKGNVSL